MFPPWSWQSSKDAIVSGGAAETAGRVDPGARLEVLEGAGHIGFLTHASEVVRRVRRHLHEVRAAV